MPPDSQRPDIKPSDLSVPLDWDQLSDEAARAQLLGIVTPLTEAINALHGKVSCEIIDIQNSDSYPGETLLIKQAVHTQEMGLASSDQPFLVPIARIALAEIELSPLDTSRAVSIYVSEYLDSQQVVVQSKHVNASLGEHLYLSPQQLIDYLNRIRDTGEARPYKNSDQSEQPLLEK